MRGTLISISSSSWIGAWMGLEINLLRFIPIIANRKNVFSTESSIKYFLIQALASTSFLFRVISLIIINRIREFYIFNWSLTIILNSSLLLKIGAAPLHFWFPEVLNKLNWLQRIILLTWQKIAPIILLSLIIDKRIFTYFIIISSVIVGRILGLNQIFMQKILAYSSINHMGWIITRIIIIENIWLSYFIVYSLITVRIIIVLKILNIFNMKQLFTNINNSILIKFSFIINFLSLGGLPPFIGFLPKWIVIQNIMNENIVTIMLIIIFIALVTLFFYIRLTFSVLILSYEENNWKANNKNLKNKKTLFFTNIISLLGLIFSTLVINII